MVQVFTCSLHDPVDRQVVDNFRRRLPHSLLSRYHSYRFEEDSRRFLLGKMLLRYALDQLGLRHLELHQLNLSAENRPHFDSPVDFSISHSGDYVACAISSTCRVGVDIEEMVQQELKPYTLCWNQDELNAIEANGLETFYDLWTRKEAVLKAAGTGLIDNLSSFGVISDTVEYAGNRWHLNRLAAPRGYSMSLAVNDDRVEVGRPVSVLFGEKAFAL